MAKWLGWRNEIVERVVVARATGLAWYSGDPNTAARYLDKIFDIISLLEANPQMGRLCPQGLSHRCFVSGSPAPGSPDTLVYVFDDSSE